MLVKVFQANKLNTLEQPAKCSFTEMVPEMILIEHFDGISHVVAICP